MDPRLSAGGVSRNLWLCFSEVAFTYSETCRSVSFDKHVRPGNPHSHQDTEQCQPQGVPSCLFPVSAHP